MQTVLDKKRAAAKPVNGNGVRPNGKPRPMLWTVEDYYAVYEAGVFEGRRVELIRGEIIEMSPMLSPHAVSIRLVSDLLSRKFGEGFEVRPQMPMNLGRFDEPEPDVAVVDGSIRDYVDGHPTTARLVVEVAFTSLRFDRTTKMRLYAENKIEDYWIVNLKQRCLEVFRRSEEDSAGGFLYTYTQTFAEDDSISPLALPDLQIKVSDMLP